MKVKNIFLYAIGLTLVFFGIGSQSVARELAEGLRLTGYLKNETYLRLHGTPDHVMSSRNIVNFDINYNFPGTVPIVRRLFIQLRPFYDTVFDWENEGTGGARGGEIASGSIITLPPLQNRHIRDKYQDNFGEADDWDPLLRECWMDIKIGRKLDGRLGRQIVSWGRSDGIYLLDLINPFNYRNWSVFDEEDVKIPLWMVNLTYSFTAFNNLQLLVIPRYVPEYDAGDGHDWAPNVVRFVEEFYADPGAFFGLPGLFGQASVRFDEPDWQDPSNWEWGVRWGGMWKGITYSLNYFYTWSDIMSDYPQDPFGLVVKRNPNRISVLGGSFDYNFQNLLGLENLVIRGEMAYFKNKVFVTGDFRNREKDSIDYMLGFDKYFLVDYWVSLQLKQSWILDSPSWRDPFLGVASRLKQLLIIPGVGTFPIAEGFRDTVETAISLFIMKDYLPGDFLHTQWFLLWTHRGDWWFRPKVTYDWSKKFRTAIGFNFYWGRGYNTFGEWTKNDNAFFEVKYDF